MSEPKNNSLQLTPDWRATVLALLLMPVLLSLGFWQLDRAAEKRQLQLLFQQRQANGPVDIEELFAVEDLQYQPVRLRGEFINEKKLFLDNRIYRGRFGYEIMTPFKLAHTQMLVMVNRGWLAGDISRRSLPEINTITGTVELNGEIYVPKSEMLRLSQQQNSGWPRVLQSVNISQLEGEFNLPLFPYRVRLNPSSPGSYQPNWVVVNLQPEKHTAYAVQWFAMTATLFAILFLANTNCWALIKGHK
ncbi:MAG: SURF1 family protein [Pseudomonadales bacterium]